LFWYIIFATKDANLPGHFAENSFIVYDNTHETKTITHEYIGSSDEELLTVVTEIWKRVDEH